MTKASHHHQATPVSRSAIGILTDELFERERDTDSAMLIKGAASPQDFEHQRIFAKVRGKLFGADPVIQMGRYRVVRRIGKGGMGEVYLGEDAELGRKVALKRVLGPGGPRGQARLRREAQLLAQLSHPNVVQVYEVGEHEGRTFLAMEYVEGSTLSAWLNEGPRRAQILTAFIAAGRGLAAAHEVGIVHRDFKPDNVLISSEGVARVVDFGLALTLADEDENDSSERAELPARVDTHTRLSPAGLVVGTMSYMPLEQLLGREVDARSDQFAFCLALYEALWGQPPFASESPDARLAGLEADEPRRPKFGGLDGVWRVLRRGLRRDPAARWPDMASLLRALERLPRRRRVWGLAGAAVVVLGIGAAGASDQLWSDPCEDLQPAWGDDAQAQLEQKFGDPDDDERTELNLLYVRLNQRQRYWQAEREQLCQPAGPWQTRQSRFELRRDELARHSQQTHDVLDYLGSDRRRLSSAHAVLAEFEPAPRNRASAQLDEQLRNQIRPLEHELDQIRMLRLFGDPASALELSRQLEESALLLGYRPLRAQVTAEIAKLKDLLARVDTDQYYELAITLARREGLDELLAELLSARIIACDAAELEQARTYHETFEATLVKLGIDPVQHPRFVYARGYLARLDDRPEDAFKDYERAHILEGEGPKQADYLRALARLKERQSLKEAIQLYEDSLEAAESFYGPRHRRTASAHYQLGLALARQALRIREQGSQWKQSLAQRTALRAAQSLERAALIWQRVGPQYLALDARLRLVEHSLQQIQLYEALLEGEPGGRTLEVEIMRAEAQLDLAFSLDSELSSDFFVMQAHLYAVQKKPVQALNSIEKALDRYEYKGNPLEDPFLVSLLELRARQCDLALRDPNASDELRKDCTTGLGVVPKSDTPTPAKP